MLERWLRDKDGLTSDPMGVANAHHLVSVSVGPVPDTWRQAKRRGALSITVGMAARSDVARHRLGHMCAPTKVEIDSGGRMHMHLPRGPDWLDHDGMLVVRIDVKSSSVFGSGVQKQFKIWWHRSFLRRVDMEAREERLCLSPWPDGPTDVLELDVAKAWIGGLHKDLQDHREVPAKFRLVAIFAD